LLIELLESCLSSFERLLPPATNFLLTKQDRDARRKQAPTHEPRSTPTDVLSELRGNGHRTSCGRKERPSRSQRIENRDRCQQILPTPLDSTPCCLNLRLEVASRGSTPIRSLDERRATLRDLQHSDFRIRSTGLSMLNQRRKLVLQIAWTQAKGRMKAANIIAQRKRRTVGRRRRFGR
jgi:hypothetical protein